MHSSLRHLTLALALAGLGNTALAQDRYEPMRMLASNGLGNTALHAALLAALSIVPLAHAAPVEMKADAVVAAPSAKALGGADFAVATRGPTLVALSSPSLGDARALKSRRQQQAKHGQPFEIGFARDVPNPRIGLARLDSRPGEARLETGDGRRFVADDPEQLLFDVLGQALPVRQLPRWLLGRTSADDQLQRDPQGRPSRLEEAGWRIDYSYDDEAPGSLPSRLHLRQGEHIDLRLRIEEWKSAP